MAKLNAEYSLKVKISDLELPGNTSRLDVEKKVREIAKNRIQGWISNKLFDPQGKIFIEEFKITPNTEQ